MLSAPTLAPGDSKNSSIAGEQANADRYVNKENVNHVIVDRYECTPVEVGVDQPQKVRHPQENSSRPYGRNGPLQCAVGKGGLVLERINNGDVAFHGYWNQVKSAHVAARLHRRCKSRSQNVIPAWLVENEDDEEQRRVKGKERSVFI